MNEYDATETAYRNGYTEGMKDSIEKLQSGIERMCEEHYKCKDCPLEKDGISYCPEDYTIKEMLEIAETVAEWMQAHPEREETENGKID